ncbi:MAG TPA: type V CRISPR-associated protein Cas4 [Niabella sp.]|nr:type V CRISPR-associated protein Cas4 [Niabella sp.]
MESYITLSFLNDFIFCPRSIYFHQLYGSFAETVYKQSPQYKGTAAHETIDERTYSTSAHILQGMEVYSEQYNICGKIDVFDSLKGRLTERKREVKTIYDGYVFQVYAQCFALREMGYAVKEIVIHDPIPLPENDAAMLAKFEQLIADIQTFDLETTPFTPLLSKCQNCIYNQLCDKSLC